MTKRIVALDPSLRKSGFAIWDSQCEIRDRLNVYTAMPEHRGVKRLHWFYQHLDNVLRPLGPKVSRNTDLLVIEGYSYGSRGRAVMQIGELGGLIRYTAYRFQIPLVTVAPAALKKFATGVGNAPKNLVLGAAIRKLDYEGHDDNEADALWLLEMACRRYGVEYDMTSRALTQYQTETLAKIKWPEL